LGGKKTPRLPGKPPGYNGTGRISKKRGENYGHLNQKPGPDGKAYGKNS